MCFSITHIVPITYGVLCPFYAKFGLDVCEAHLQKNDWLALGRPTIAEPACFPYIETAPEAKVALEDYPAIVKWMERCKKLPGWPVR